MSENNQFTDILNDLRKEVNRLSTDDISSVIHSVGKVLEAKITEDPYRTLATALGIGYGLSALNRSHLKHGAIRIGKLVAMKAISNMDSAPQITGEQNESQQQKRQA